ncbi:MAG TPA: aminotransferase class IV [Syntrophomonadaceae bacterium]|jgi:branched-chain amino acid aminotransferase|nr:aminotransferase class IV [Syntrophomonadaceae bacterium]
MEISKYKLWLKNDQPMKQEELPPDFIEQGVSLYEVLRVIKSVPIFLEQHLERLNRTAHLTGLKLPLDDETIGVRLKELISMNQVDSGNIKLVINYASGHEAVDFYAYFVEESYPSPADYQNGVKTVLVEAERPNPNAKVDRADYRRKIDEAIRLSGAYEALLVDHAGFVSEGGRSNLFMISGDAVITAPADKVLKGITRQMVFAACERRGYKVLERDTLLTEMLTMDGIFISGTSPKVLPVNHVDGHSIPSAQNPIIRDIMSAYDAIIEEYIRRHGDGSSVCGARS